MFGKTISNALTDNLFCFLIFFIDQLSFEAILSSVGFISYNYYIFSVRELVVNGFVVFWQKLLNGSKYNTSTRYFEQLFQMFSILCLYWFLSQKLNRGSECVKKLVVQIIAVSDDYNCRIS